MPSDTEELIETTIDGPRTRRWVLESKDCRELAAHRIARMGIDDAAHPYQRVRRSPSGSFVMVCTGGKGRILLDGRWQTVGAGTVCMAPPRVLNAFLVPRGSRWSFCWLRFDEPEPVSPLVGAASPVRLQGGSDLVRAMEGLRAEWDGDARSANDSPLDRTGARCRKTTGAAFPHGRATAQCVAKSAARCDC